MATEPKQRFAGDTSKAKPAIAKDLGMSLAAIESLSICWVPVPMDAELKQLLTDVANARSTEAAKVKPHAILSKLCTEALASKRKDFEKEAETATRARAAELTPEELQAAADRAQRALDKAMALLKAARKS